MYIYALGDTLSVLLCEILLCTEHMAVRISIKETGRLAAQSPGPSRIRRDKLKSSPLGKETSLLHVVLEPNKPTKAQMFLETELCLLSITDNL